MPYSLLTRCHPPRAITRSAVTCRPPHPGAPTNWRRPTTPGRAHPSAASPANRHRPTAPAHCPAVPGRHRPPTGIARWPPHPVVPLHSHPSLSGSPPSAGGFITERVTALHCRPPPPSSHLAPRRPPHHRPGPGMVLPTQPSPTPLTATR
jgi:hypothetical protein